MSDILVEDSQILNFSEELLSLVPVATVIGVSDLACILNSSKVGTRDTNLEVKDGQSLSVIKRNKTIVVLDSIIG